MENLTDIDDIELAEIKLELDRDSVNPMELKKRLAREIVSQFHEGESALAAEQYFERTVLPCGTRGVHLRLKCCACSGQNRFYL